jgi:hypothetical protein
VEEVVTDEIGVAEFYLRTTATFCLPIASTLALHPKASFSEWFTLLAWSQSRNGAGHAIADGLLRFRVDNKPKSLLIADTLEPRTRQLFDELRKSSVPLATFEMKSIAAGSIEVMTAILKLGDFAWTSCGDTTYLRSQKHETRRKKVKDVVIGTDAEHPPWTLDARFVSFKLKTSCLFRIVQRLGHGRPLDKLWHRLLCHLHQ